MPVKVVLGVPSMLDLARMRGEEMGGEVPGGMPTEVSIWERRKIKGESTVKYSTVHINTVW